MSPSASRVEDVGALAAALAAGEDRDVDAGGVGERRDGRRRCWRARISVGAISAAWRPASITVAAASSATTVLPEPTSPCSSRSMRSGLARSATMSATARACDGGERIGQGRDELLAQLRRRRRWRGRPAGA